MLSVKYISISMLVLYLLCTFRYSDSVNIVSSSSSSSPSTSTDTSPDTVSSSSSPSSTWRQRSKRIYSPGKPRTTGTINDPESASAGIGAPVFSTIDDGLTKESFQSIDNDNDMLNYAEVFSLPERITRYCANPPFSGHEEAHAPLPDYQLIHTTIIARHGDRSAIHRIPGIVPINFLCNRPNENETSQLISLFYPFQSTPQCVAEGNTYCENLTDPPLMNGKDEALGIWGRIRGSTEICAPGQLSGKGWEQVLHLGLDMGEQYSTLLTRNDMEWTVPLKVVTTNYGRTMLTAAGLTTGILASIHSAVVLHPHNYSSSSSSTSSSTIHQEFLHSPGISTVAAQLPTGTLPGLQLPLPIHIVPRMTDLTLWPKNDSVCDRAKTMQTMDLSTMFAHAYPPNDVSVTIASNAEIPMDQVPLTEEIVDDLYTRFCHGYGTPCWEKETKNNNEEKNYESADKDTAYSSTGNNVNELPIDPLTGSTPSSTIQCFSTDQISRLIASGDALYHHRFSNRATVLLTYPLLKNIATTLRRSAQHTKNSSRLMIRAAHDTGLSPLLATLGAHDGVYAWPGYAARVNFELWEINNPSSTTVASSATTDSNMNKGYNNPLRYLVRLLYNGIDFTSRLSCAKQYPIHGSKEKEENNGNEKYTQWACTLIDFESMIEMLLAPFPSWDMACNTPLGTEENRYTSGAGGSSSSSSSTDSSNSNAPILL